MSAFTTCFADVVLLSGHVASASNLSFKAGIGLHGKAAVLSAEDQMRGNAAQPENAKLAHNTALYKAHTEFRCASPGTLCLRPSLGGKGLVTAAVSA